MGPLHTNIVIGSASARAEHAADLGKLVLVDGKFYRMVKATAAINLITIGAGGLVVATAVANGVPTWSVALPGSTKPPTNRLGVIPLGQTDSTGAVGLKAGDYFMMQVSGPAKCIVGTAAIAAAAVSAGGLFPNSNGKVRINAVHGSAITRREVAMGINSGSINPSASIGVMLKGIL